MKAHDTLELLGFVLIVAFFAVWWWPSALLVAGIGLVVAATLAEREAKNAPGEPEQEAAS